MSMHKPASRQRMNGFTLVEVLIALTLMAMLMVLLTAAMRNMGQTQTAVQARIDQSDDYRTTVNFLRDILGEVSARPLAQSVVHTDAPRVMFKGNGTELVWIGVLPARYGMGGRHHMRLALEEGALTLYFAPWQGEMAINNWGAAQRLVLAQQVQGMALRYQDPRDGFWLPAWPPEDNLPQEFSLPSAVQLDMSAEWVWPSLVVAVNGAVASDPSAIRIRFGGGDR